MVQWLGLWAFTAKGPGSIPGQGTKILQVSQCGQKKKNPNKEKNQLHGVVPGIQHSQYLVIIV